MRTWLRFNILFIVIEENLRKEKWLMNLGLEISNNNMETEIITKGMVGNSKAIVLLSEGRDQVIFISEIWNNWCMKLQSQEHLCFKKTVKWSWFFQAHYSDICNIQLCAGGMQPWPEWRAEHLCNHKACDVQKHFPWQPVLMEWGNERNKREQKERLAPRFNIFIFITGFYMW